MSEINITSPANLQNAYSSQYISFMAIFIGSLVIIGLSFLLNLLFLSLGVSAYSMSSTGKATFAAGGFIILMLLNIIVMFLGGWAAGYLAKIPRIAGEMYGFTAWALALVITILLAAQSGQFMVNASYVVSRDMSVTNILPESTYNSMTAAATTQANRGDTSMPASSLMAIKEKPEKAVASVLFVTFILFLIGALSATFGGRVGLRYQLSR